GRVVWQQVYGGMEGYEGQVLIRLGTRQLGVKIAEQRQKIESGDKFLADLAVKKQALLAEQQATREQARADLALASEELGVARGDQVRKVRAAEVDLTLALSDFETTQQLEKNHAAPPETLEQNKAKADAALVKKQQAEVAVGEAKVGVARTALALVGLAINHAT